MKYFIAFGSNKGKRLDFIKNAKQELGSIGTVIRYSSVYENPPMGDSTQDNFLNALCELETDLNPQRLLRKLKIIETKLGRKRSFHWGPREIDLDIIDWNGKPVDSPLLKIPHHGMEERNFVLLPLKELKADYISRSGKSINHLISRFSGTKLKLISSEW